MKIFSKLFILVCLTIVFFDSCEKDCIKSTGINGEWIWIKSTGFATITPATEGYSKKLKIDDFIFQEYVNDSLIFESQYDLVIDSSGEPKKLIKFDSNNVLRIEIGESELVLDEEVPDALIEHYKRD